MRGFGGKYGGRLAGLVLLLAVGGLPSLADAYALSRSTKAKFSRFRITRCQPHTQSSQAPTMVVGILKSGVPHEWRRNLSLDIGTTLHLSLDRSSPHPLRPGPLFKKWLFLPPKHHQTRLKPRAVRDDIRITVDAPGVYRFVAVLKDKSNRCVFRHINIRATVNKKLKALDQYYSVARMRRFFDWSRFEWLQELDTDRAWDISEGHGQVIAIVDTGVDYNHPFLRHNIFINQGEIPDNNIDDDNNGYVDDAYGYDFYNRDPYAFDDGVHGTAMAGFAASSVFGQARGAKILPLKVVDAVGNGDEKKVGEAIRYAVNMGASVISMSLGLVSPPYKHHPVLKAIEYARQKGVLVVAPAGNGDPITRRGRDLNLHPRYPACFSVPNVVGVAATRRDIAFLSKWSDYGLNCVDVGIHGGEMIQGEGLLSTTTRRPGRNKALARMSGTSVSTALVAGIIALIQAKAPHLTADEVLQLLLRSGQYSVWLSKYIVSSRRLNALAPLQDL